MNHRRDYDALYDQARQTMDALADRYYQHAATDLYHRALHTHVHPVDLLYLIDVWRGCTCGAVERAGNG